MYHPCSSLSTDVFSPRVPRSARGSAPLSGQMTLMLIRTSLCCRDGESSCLGKWCVSGYGVPLNTVCRPDRVALDKRCRLPLFLRLAPLDWDHSPMYGDSPPALPNVLRFSSFFLPPFSPTTGSMDFISRGARVVAVLGCPSSSEACATTMELSWFGCTGRMPCETIVFPKGRSRRPLCSRVFK